MKFLVIIVIFVIFVSFVMKDTNAWTTVLTSITLYKKHLKLLFIVKEELPHIKSQWIMFDSKSATNNHDSSNVTERNAWHKFNIAGFPIPLALHVM